MAVKILFVCTGNTCRSPLAEMLARRILAKEGVPAEITSAGMYTITGLPWSKDSLDIAEEWGLDNLGHTSTLLNAELIEKVDLVLVMARRHKRWIQEHYPSLELEHKLFLLKEFLGIAATEGVEVRDPYGENRAAYTAVALELQRILAKLPEMLRQHKLI